MCTSVDTVGSGSPVRSAIQHSGVTNLPSTIWLVTTGMQAVPKRLKEVVAESESLWRRMSRIVLPFSAPSISTATFLSLINGGGAFLVALVIMLSPSQTPAPLALYNFVHFGTTQYGQIVAFSTLFSLPLFILYVVVPASSRAGSRSPARSTGDVDAHFRATDPASETPCRYSALGPCAPSRARRGPSAVAHQIPTTSLCSVDDLALLGRLVWLCCVEHLTQAEIARRLDVSRFRVLRTPKACR